MTQETIKFSKKNKQYLLEVNYGIRQTESPYFTITGNVYESIPSRDSNRYRKEYGSSEVKRVDGIHYLCYSSGCIHEEIKEATDKFDDMITLHLADIEGRPMHCFANSWYNLKENTFKSAEKFCSYYRIPINLYQQIMECKNLTDYQVFLISNGILDKWKSDAENVISKYNL